jgi:hypothetical protein
MKRFFSCLLAVTAVLSLASILKRLYVWDEKNREAKLVRMTAKTAAFDRRIGPEEGQGEAGPKNALISEGKRPDHAPPEEEDRQPNASSFARSGRPRLVLHIGPHKTATSTIQCELTFLRETLRSAATHEYIGRIYRECRPNHNNNKDEEEQRTSSFVSNVVDTRRLISCLDKHSQDKPCSDKKDWKRFEILLERLAESERHVIMSDEAFSRIKATDSNLALLSATLSKRFQVQVVIVYRRYWEWLLSMYNEKYKPLPRRQKYQKWPDEGGIAVRTFPDYYRRLNNKGQGIGGYQLAAEREDVHPAEYLKRLFGKHFGEVVLFNMHRQEEGGDLSRNFIGQIFPETRDVLQKQRDHPTGRPNPSMNLDYDLLAVAAREHGLLKNNASLQRREVARAVAVLLQKLPPNATALECLTAQEEAALLNRSLFLEHHLFPNQSDAEAALQQHRSEFAKASQLVKFCNVDTAQAMEDASWQQFFRSL